MAQTEPVASKYRADIDGLRAFAVLCVLFYHVEVPFFSGGFIGVDIFFVISGFLITRLIRDEVLTTGAFRFGNFYMRRLRRLFPALFATFLVSAIFAYLLLSPGHLERFGGALFHSVLSVGNFFFWQESGYFDVDASFKPLLHTWSLSVEEQFYLVWPAVIVMLMIRVPGLGAQIFLVAAIVASLILNLLFADGEVYLIEATSSQFAELFADGRATIFYLAPFRVFEFAIGALVVWLVEFPAKNKIIPEVLTILGLLMIITPVYAFTSDTLFPSYNALVPCVGAALLIYTGHKAVFAGRLLNNTLAVDIGLFSYSLYLIHWPILVFYKYWTLEPLDVLEQAVIIVGSLTGATLMYRFIEQPYRRNSSHLKIPDKVFGLVCMSLVILMTLPAANMWANTGWRWRMDTLISDEDMNRYRTERFDFIQVGCTLEHYVTGDDSKNSDGSARCKPNAVTQVLVLGDSHVIDGFNSLYSEYAHDPQVNIIFTKGDGGVDHCGFVVTGKEIVATIKTENCKKRTDLFNNLDWDQIDLITLEVFERQERHFSNINNLVLSFPHLKAIIFGSYIGVRPYFCAELINRFKSFSACKDPTYVSQFKRDKHLDKILPEGRFLYIDTIRLFCGTEKNLENCPVSVGDGLPVFLDGDHLSRYSAAERGRRMNEVYAKELKELGL